MYLGPYRERPSFCRAHKSADDGDRPTNSAVPLWECCFVWTRQIAIRLRRLFLAFIHFLTCTYSHEACHNANSRRAIGRQIRALLWMHQQRSQCLCLSLAITGGETCNHGGRGLPSGFAVAYVPPCERRFRKKAELPHRAFYHHSED